MSAFDDKRFIKNDGIHCLPYGHFEIRDWQLHREILEGDDWGDEEREEATETSPTWSTLIRHFTVFPSSNIPSLSNYDADRERSNHEVETQTSNEIFTPPDPGMHQRDYSENELEKSLTSINKQQHIQVLDEETLSLRTKLKKIPFEISIPTMMMWQSTIVP